MNSTKYTVLYLEDGLVDAEVVQQLVYESDQPFALEHVSTLADAMRRLSETWFDAVLSDLSLPDADGLDTVQRLHERAPDIPIILLTALDCDELALQALDHGAQDYLVKSRLDADRLARSIRYAIQRQQILRENRRLARSHAEQGNLLRSKNRKLSRAVTTAQTFVDNVSHEFRTPLTVIKEYAALLREGVLGDLNEEQCGFLDTIADRADDLNNMVNDMLDSSRVRAGILRVDRRACQVRDVVSRVSVGLKRKAGVRGVSLEFDFEDDLPEVFCDAEKVGRILINLAVNAIKFCEDPGRVVISGRRLPMGDVQISVADNGPGMDAEQQLVIFERFRQLGTNTNSSTKGFGLGLNIVRELVDLSFGRMKVQSRPGEGSVFSFTLPAYDPREIASRYARRLKRNADGPLAVSVISSTIDPGHDANSELRGFWSYVQRGNDVVLQVAPSRWLFLLQCTATELPQALARVQQEWENANRNRPQGPLPELHLAAEGSWSMADDCDAFERWIEHCCDPTATCVTAADTVASNRREQHSDSPTSVA